MIYKQIILVLVHLTLSAAANAASPVTKAEEGHVIFVCEFGSVKSLMAASYFNQLAEQKELAVRAISRASAPRSMTVPVAVVDGLRQDGIDVAGFKPLKVSAADVSKSQRVILIDAALPDSAQQQDVAMESWNDVPRVSGNFPAARNMLKQQIEKLMEQFSGSTRQ